MLTVETIRDILAQTGIQHEVVGVCFGGRIVLAPTSFSTPQATAIIPLMQGHFALDSDKFFRSLIALSEPACVIHPCGLRLIAVSIEHVSRESIVLFLALSLDRSHSTLLARLSEAARKTKKAILIQVNALAIWSSPLSESHAVEVLSAARDRVQALLRDVQHEIFKTSLLEYKDFVSSFAHEALGPMQEIRNSLELSLQDESLAAKVKGRLTSSLRAIDTLRTSLEGMRLLFREDTHRPLTNQFRSVNIRDIVERWCECYDSQFTAKRINCYILPDTVWWVHCIPEYIEVLVNNIVGNAVKYSFDASIIPEGGKFIARFEENTSTVRFTNYGVPIPLADIETGDIFALGTRGRSADDRGRVGKGVGLFLVKKIAELHGAKVEVVSNVKNPGSENEFAKTEFSIRFPEPRQRKGGRRLFR